MIGLHNLKVPRGAHKKKKILGRGPSSGHGDTSTRGNKGQGHRTGHTFYRGFEGGQMPLIRKIPKRGFRSRNKIRNQIVNIERLNEIKEDLINPEVLERYKLIRKKELPVKILGRATLKKAITLEGVEVSGNVKEAIQQLGGKCSPR